MTASSMSSRPRPMMAAAPCQSFRRSPRSRVAFGSVAPNRRWPKVLPSSAIIACWKRTEPACRRQMSVVPEPSAAFDIERLLAAMRPRLHRYCARMVGSVIDGEDVLQDALIKAVEAQAAIGNVGNPEGWLFRIAHNTALHFVRRRNR